MRRVIVVLYLLVFTTSVFAQADTSYVSQDRSILFRYPATWSVQEIWEEEGVGLGSSAEVLTSEDEAVFDKDVYVHVSAKPLSRFVDVRNLPDALATTQVEGDEEIVIRGQPALLKRWDLDTIDAFDLRIQSPTAILFVSAISRPAKLDQFEADIFDIANSLRYIPIFENFGSDVNCTFDTQAASNVLWPQGVSELGKLKIDDGLYSVAHLQTEHVINVLMRNQRLYENARISMTAVVNASTTEKIRSFGIIFRQVDGANYYYFEIFTSGLYSLWKAVDGEWTSLLEGNSWPEHEATLPLEGRVTLEVTMSGDTITIAANGIELTQVIDDTFTVGRIGFSSTPNDVAEATLFVDQFSVEALPPAD